MQNNIHNNLEMIILIAKEKAKQHNCNYNIIIMNPDKNGQFDEAEGSTYEFVADSYFEKERPHVKMLHKTDDLLATEMSK